ncbi:MAG: DUF6600 domain-containing protein [Bryobacteraceae bacterium]
MNRTMHLGLVAAMMAASAWAQFQPPPPYSQPPQPYPPQSYPQSYPQQSYPPQSYPSQQQPPYGQAPQGYPPQQPRQPQGDGGDAPDRGVARISYMNGNVSVRRGDSGDLVAAVMNVPLVASDRLVTADGARAEVQLDFANIVRLGSATEVRFSELAYGRFQIQVATGTTTYRVLRDSTAQVEISTPTVSVRPEKKGIYRITVHPDGTTEVSVRSGDAEVFSPRGSEQLHSGKTMMARGTAADPEFQIVNELSQDDFDRWSATRDHDLERSTSPRYVSRDVYGTEDLDQNGRWQNDPQYGNVWVPNVDPGWAPYQCGRWVWIDFYGWSWVGCEPWGWAPYHYGRWYSGPFGWAWYPGPVYANYFWRPALVGFFGWGAPGIGIGIGFGFGNVGWVPLAPFEAFHPWYGAGIYAGFRGGVSVNNVGIVNNTNIVSAYRNARFANGVTSMNAANFGRAEVSRATMTRASAADLSRAGMVRGQMPITPSRESTQFSNRAASSQGLPRTSENARFVSRTQPSSVSHVPFEQQRQSINRTFSSSNAAAPRGGSNAGGASSNGGWQRFDPSTRSGSSSATQGNAAGGRSYSAPQPGTRSYNTPQSVRISPPIVQNRASGPSGSGSGSTSGAGSRGGGSRGGGSRGGGNRK